MPHASSRIKEDIERITELSAELDELANQAAELDEDHHCEQLSISARQEEIIEELDQISQNLSKY